jgi:hypothetical protein
MFEKRQVAIPEHYWDATYFDKHHLNPDSRISLPASSVEVALDLFRQY